MSGAGKPGGPTRTSAAAPRTSAPPPPDAPRTSAPPPDAPRTSAQGPWPCYWLERTGECEVGLRRYSRLPRPTLGWTCADGWHQAVEWLGVRRPYDYEDRIGSGHLTFPRAESVYPMPGRRSRRWPRECDAGCGYRFAAGDAWQVWCEDLYRDDSGREWTLHHRYTPPGCERAAAGAMWDAPWKASWSPNPAKPDDGIHLMVRCPSISGRAGSDWCPDSAASSGGFWTRTGDPRRPPTLTVSPSIQTGDYHGHLQAGRLTPHVG